MGPTQIPPPPPQPRPHRQRSLTPRQIWAVASINLCFPLICQECVQPCHRNLPARHGWHATPVEGRDRRKAQENGREFPHRTLCNCASTRYESSDNNFNCEKTLTLLTNVSQGHFSPWNNKRDSFMLYMVSFVSINVLFRPSVTYHRERRVKCKILHCYILYIPDHLGLQGASSLADRVYV